MGEEANSGGMIDDGVACQGFLLMRQIVSALAQVNDIKGLHRESLTGRSLAKEHGLPLVGGGVVDLMGWIEGHAA